MQVPPAGQAGYPEILQRASLGRALQVSSAPLLAETEIASSSGPTVTREQPLGTGFDTHRPVWAHSRMIGTIRHKDSQRSFVVRSQSQGTLSCRPIPDTDPEYPRDTLFFFVRESVILRVQKRFNRLVNLLKQSAKRFLQILSLACFALKSGVNPLNE